jgi:hypothetical protein
LESLHRDNYKHQHKTYQEYLEERKKRRRAVIYWIKDGKRRKLTLTLDNPSLVLKLKIPRQTQKACNRNQQPKKQKPSKTLETSKSVIRILQRRPNMPAQAFRPQPRQYVNQNTPKNPTNYFIRAGELKTVTCTNPHQLKKSAIQKKNEEDQNWMRIINAAAYN